MKFPPMPLPLRTENAINIPLPGGGYLSCDPGEQCDFGGSVRLLDHEGNEVAMWDSSEWAEHPEGVMGAIFCAASLPVAQVVQNLAKTKVEDGCWV